MPGVYNTLTEISDGFLLTTKDKTKYEFSQAGNLTSIENIQGNKINLIYENGRLSKLENECGYLQFEYIGNLLKKISDQDGRFVEYDYLDSNLVNIKNIDGNTYKYQYDSQNRIVKTIDPLNNATITNIYDNKNRILEQTMGDGTRNTFAYDDQNMTTTLTDRNGAQIIYKRDDKFRIYETVYVNGSEKKVINNKNQITSYTDKNGNTYDYEYDNSGNITKETDPLGLINEFTYDDNNRITSIIKADGSIYNYTYDQKGNLLSAKDPLERELKSQYNSKGLPEKITLPDGSYSTIEYDTKGNPVKVTDPVGNTTSFEYDGLNRVTKIIKPLGNKIEYEYTNSGKIKKLVNADGTYTEALYDARGLVVEEKDANGSVTKYKYNSMGKLIEKTDALNNVTKYEYDSMWNVSKVILPNGSVTTYNYNQANLLQSVTNSVYDTINLEYDSNGNILKETDPLGNSTQYRYDELNRIVKTIDAKNSETSYEYGLNGKLKKVVDALNNASEYEYDAAGQLVKIKDALGNITEYTYNSLGYVETVTDAKGAITKYGYNSNGKLEKATLPDGTANMFEYDANGNLIKATEAEGNSTKYTYDNMDRVKTIQNALHGIKTVEYTNAGKVSAVNDENGNKTRYKYDELDRLTEVVDANDNKTSYAYDSVDNLTEVHRFVGINDDVLNKMNITGVQDEVYNPGNIEVATKYLYDLRGLLTKEINPAGKVTVYEYDANGNLISKTDREGLTTKFDYDPVNNLKKATYNDGKQVEYGYNPLGEVVSMKDWIGNTNFELDALGRVLKVNDYKNRITEYTWSPVGEKNSIKYPDGSIVNYEYDIMGRLQKVNDAKNKVTAYKYDSLGNVSEKLLPNGIKTEYKYDALSRLNQLASSDKAGKITDDFRYTYDAVGNKTEIIKNKEVTGYRYDDLNQLVEVSKPNNMVEKYFYDTLGNRVRQERWNPKNIVNAANYRYDVEGRLIEISGNGIIDIADQHISQQVQMEYDNRGNLIKTISDKKALSQYVFDASNRLTNAVNSHGDSTSFVYDGFGRRVSMKVDQKNAAAQQNVELEYVLDITKPYDNVIMINKNGNESQMYTYGLEMLSADTMSDRLYYLHDELGSPIRLVDEKGKTAEAFSYDEFGRPLNKSGKTCNIFSYTGYQYDASTGLMYAQARYYMPEVGRFISEDSLEGQVNDPLSLNLYTYVSNNPILYTDPDGHKQIVSDIKVTMDFDTGKQVTLKRYEYTDLNIVVYELPNKPGFFSYSRYNAADGEQSWAQDLFNLQDVPNAKKCGGSGTYSLDTLKKLDSQAWWKEQKLLGSALLSTTSDAVTAFKFLKAIKGSETAGQALSAVVGTLNPVTGTGVTEANYIKSELNNNPNISWDFFWKSVGSLVPVIGTKDDWSKYLQFKYSKKIEFED